MEVLGLALGECEHNLALSEDPASWRSVTKQSPSSGRSSVRQKSRGEGPPAGLIEMWSRKVGSPSQNCIPVCTQPPGD